MQNYRSNSCLCSLGTCYLTPNGPAVWLGAVGACPEWSEGSGCRVFCQSRKVDESCLVTMKLSRRYQVRVRIVNFGSRWNSLDGEQKTRHQRVSRQPYWLCLGGRICPGATNFISWCDFTLIDFGGRLRSCPGCRSQLIKPSELGGRSNYLNLKS